MSATRISGGRNHGLLTARTPLRKHGRSRRELSVRDGQAPTPRQSLHNRAYAERCTPDGPGNAITAGSRSAMLRCRSARTRARKYTCG
ncbi:hypothetical protein MRX96_036144 [Rhipicephalus microplus]